MRETATEKKMRLTAWAIVLGSIAAGAAVTFAVSSCVPSPFPQKVERTTVTRSVDRFVDAEHGVVCYLYMNSGISCVRIDTPRVEAVTP